MLNINHIQHYPIGGENALRVLNIKQNRVDKLWCIRKFPEGDEFISLISLNGTREALLLSEIKPLLRPMSDLYKKRNGKIDIVELAKMVTNMMIHVDQISFDDSDDCVYAKVHGHDDNDKVVVFGFNNGEFWLAEKHTGKFINQLLLFQYLFENHYNVFNLPTDEWIDINTVEV